MFWIFLAWGVIAVANGVVFLAKPELAVRLNSRRTRRAKRQPDVSVGISRRDSVTYRLIALVFLVAGVYCLTMLAMGLSPLGPRYDVSL